MKTSFELFFEYCFIYCSLLLWLIFIGGVVVIEVLKLGFLERGEGIEWVWMGWGFDLWLDRKGVVVCWGWVFEFK